MHPTEREKTMEEETQPKEKKSRKVREMKDYQFALWKDGKGFFKEGADYTLIKNEAKIFNRHMKAIKAVSDLQELAGIDGLAIIELK